MKRRQPATRRQGQALLGVTISLIFLFGVMGLSVDLGWAYYLKARVQTSADAAASAAAVYAASAGDDCASLSCGVVYTCAGVTPPTTSLQAGCLYATTDGPPALTATMIENNTAPPGVTGNSPSMWIKATVSTTAPNFFLFGSGYHVANIAAQAIAGLAKSPSGNCVYVLSPNAPQALSITGSSNLTGSGCGVFVNSNNSSALSVTGSSHVNASRIRLGCATCYSITGSSSTTPAAAAYQVGTTSDPLASLPAPAYSGCDSNGYTLGNGNSGSIGPGVYCGGITVTGAARLTLSAGIYILNGGGLTVSNSATLTGSHVMFYNTGSAGHTIAPVSITGSAIATLTAPDTGTYQGIAFFQDRTQTYATANSISNSGTGSITGTYYFPTTAFNFTGATAAATTAAFVAKTIAITGSSTLSNDTTGTATGLFSKTASLIQ